MTLLHRKDPLKNLARFYAVSIERSLFDEFLVVRLWGRVGTLGRQRSEPFPNQAAALAAGERLIGTKRRRGYHEPTADDASPSTPVALAPALSRMA